MHYNNNRENCGKRQSNVPTEVKPQEIQEQYRLALQKLNEQNDLESILFLRIVAETGMRLRDAYELKPSEIIVRKIHKRSLKTGKFEKYPLISEETEKIAEQLLERQDRFLSKEYRYYTTKIMCQFSDCKIGLLDIMQYRRNKERISC